MLTLAVQKSGRLSEKTFKLLQECDIEFNGLSKRSLKLEASNFPIQLLMLRDDDIPECVADNIAQIGIVGENTLVEKNYDLKITKRLGFSRCRLSLAIPKRFNFKDLSDLNSKKIATSYPFILQNFLDKNHIGAEIYEISGSVEIAPGIGLADIIFDIVSSGSTLITNGLKEFHTVMHSEAVLTESSKMSKEQKDILKKLIFRIEGVQKAQHNKYIILNAPNNAIGEICRILPGMKSPTVTPLAEKGWSALYSVIEENAFWENIDKLKKAGAQGILVVPIEKMIL